MSKAGLANEAKDGMGVEVPYEPDVHEKPDFDFFDALASYVGDTNNEKNLVEPKISLNSLSDKKVQWSLFGY